MRGIPDQESMTTSKEMLGEGDDHHRSKSILNCFYGAGTGAVVVVGALFSWYI